MIKAWLLRPLFQKKDIDRRADAVEELAHGAGALALQELREILAKVGDLDSFSFFFSLRKKIVFLRTARKY